MGDVALDDETLPFLHHRHGDCLRTACSAPTTNTAKLYFGCDDGCIHDETPHDSANLDSAPNLSVALAPETLSICEGDVELTLTNDGARAYSNTLTVTVPGGYEVYTYTLGPNAPSTDTVTGLPGAAPVFYWDELPGRTSTTPYTFTMNLSLRNSGTAGTCPAIEPETVTATLQYDDHAECADSGPYVVSDTQAINIVVSHAED